jgi:hypothetical protein
MPLLGDMEKEELRNALVLTQESAAIQILLECCLPTPQERASGSQLTALQAPQFSIPCFSVHQETEFSRTFSLLKGIVS